MILIDLFLPHASVLTYLLFFELAVSMALLTRPTRVQQGFLEMTMDKKYCESEGRG